MQQFVDIVRQQTDANPTRAQVIDVYEQALDAFTHRLAGLMGPLGVQAVLDRSVQLRGKQQPLVHEISAEAGKPSLDGLRLNTADLDVASTETLLADFTSTFLDVLCSLIGATLVDPLVQSFGQQFRRPGTEV